MHAARDCLTTNPCHLDNLRLSTGCETEIPQAGRVVSWACFNVWAMNLFESFAHALAAGAIDMLAAFDRGMLVDLGANPTRVREWSKIRDVYYGPTRFKRQQAKAISLARTHGASLDKLAFIERSLRSLDDDTERWRLRHRLLELRGPYNSFTRRAKEILPAQEPSVPEDYINFSESKDGKRRFSGSGDEHLMAALEHRLRDGLDTSKPSGPQMMRNFADILTGNGGGVQVPVPRPILAVPVPDFVRIMAGEGDEVVLALSDGTTMTGAEFLAAQFGDILEVAAFHPEVGAVNLYRTERRANQKQRDLAKMVSPVCAFPGCRHGADACELHHVTAWKHGGETNLDNLAPLCRYHNRINDDDPWRKKRGRIVMIRGAPVWISPRGYPVKNTNRGILDRLFR